MNLLYLEPSLFHSASEEVYSTQLVEYRRKWDAQFEEYYTTEIQSLTTNLL